MVLLLRFLHLLAVATWFGGTLTTAGDVRRTLARGAPHTEALAERVGRQLAIGRAAGFLTAATGIGLILAFGGFRAVSPRIHAGLALTLVLVTLESTVLVGVYRGLAEDLAGGRLDDARARAKKFAALTGVSHLLRTIVFALMVFRWF